LLHQLKLVVQSQKSGGAKIAPPAATKNRHWGHRGHKLPVTGYRGRRQRQIRV